MKPTIKLNRKDVPIKEAIKQWEEAGICQKCINRRVELNNTSKDIHMIFSYAHVFGCTCK